MHDLPPCVICIMVGISINFCSHQQVPDSPISKCSRVIMYLLLVHRYARKVELANGRAAMIGFVSSAVMEALTGHGVIGQVVIYLKLAGLLGENSGF